MVIIPAIDLLDGKVVRLIEGRRDRVTVYSDPPGELARRYLDAGAHRIHVVDLNGAFSGARENDAALDAILQAGASVQLGGGVRDAATAWALLRRGIDAAVIGTWAARHAEAFVREDPELLAQLIVAVDARDGRVHVQGWDQATDLDAQELAVTVAKAGVAGVLYTDIARDGTGHGPNVAVSAALAGAIAPVELIASGGIGSLDDLRALAQARVPATVVGRALLEGAFTLQQALAAC